MSLADRVAGRPIDAWLDEHGDGLVAIRRQIHAHPEPSGEEHATTELIAERLTLAGLEPRSLSSGTGLLCDIGPTGGGRLALRADLDALAMADEKDVPYRSQVPGVAHGCGHDVHTTIMLGTALYLARHPEAMPGPLRFIFQPAEERVPGGALEAIADGALDGVDAVLGIHCDPQLDLGAVAIGPGPISSAADMIEIVLSGPGGHTARPERTVDMVGLVAHLVRELPGRVAGALPDDGATRVVFGMVSAGDAANVIPSRATLRASVRTPSAETWERLPAIVEGAVMELVDGSGATVELDYTHGVPPVVNDAAMSAIVRAAAIEELGVDAVRDARRSWGGDDFAWYLRERPGAYVRLGVHGPGRPRLDLHSGRFDVDEDAIGVGLRLVAAAATAYHERR